MGLVKVAPRVQGKLVENEAGVRLLIVEQKGADIWRGREKSITDAIQAGTAGIGVDKLLLTRARDKHAATVVMVLAEDLRTIYITLLSDFFDDQLSKGKTSWKGRALRIVPLSRFHQKYLGPTLHIKSSRSNA
jgi:hypothetical protein